MAFEEVLKVQFSEYHVEPMVFAGVPTESAAPWLHAVFADMKVAFAEFTDFTSD